MDIKAEQKAASRLAARVMERVGASSPRGVKCPREQSPMTPCVARDGAVCVADDGVCVGCGMRPTELLAGLQKQAP